MSALTWRCFVSSCPGAMIPFFSTRPGFKLKVSKLIRVELLVFPLGVGPRCRKTAGTH